MTAARGGRRAHGPWNGWALVGWVTLGVTAMLAVIFAIQGGGEDAWRMAIRATARSSLVLFLLSFAASGLRRLWPNGATAWLLRNRRAIGVSFAVSHAAHALVIFGIAARSPTFRAEIDALTLVGGGTAYLFIAAMTATSFDRSAAWLGRRRWKQLHTVGGWVVWSIFLFDYLGLGLQSPGYLPALAAVLGVGALRVGLRLRARRGTPAGSDPGVRGAPLRISR